MKYQKFFWQIFLSMVALSAISITFYIVLFRTWEQELETLLVSVLVSAAIASVFAFTISRQLISIRNHLQKIARGLFQDDLLGMRTDVVEIRELVDAVEKVRKDLNSQIQTIRVQRDELDALLASMSEGVLAIDANRNVLHVNKAAHRILGIEVDIRGRPVFEVVRIPEVTEFIELGLKNSNVLERDLELPAAKSRFLQMHSSPLFGEKSDIFGVVLVFSDVTRLRELEGMRKNFVANVSHELRTPLTSIQGFAETLLNPKMTDPNETKRFLEIIQRHASRLGRIIEDILTLSRIERDSESEIIELKKQNVLPTLQNAVELCLVKAQKKNIQLAFHCAADLAAFFDPYLMEQAIVNLIDNAIRYSQEGGRVDVSAEKSGNNVIFKVNDTGVGIPEKQLERVFERFYRVDKARSRELGGTGLGLSIVKHIALAHKGSVAATSELGKGSQFTISIPTEPHQNLT